MHYIGFKALEKITEHYWWQKAFQRDYGGGPGGGWVGIYRFVTLVLLVSQSGEPSDSPFNLSTPQTQILGPYMHEEISEWLQGGSCGQDLHA